MKKLVLLGAVAFFGMVSAQRVQKGEAQVNAGVGFGGGLGLPVYAGVDFGVHNDITVGAEASYATSSVSNYGFDSKMNWFGVGANANYHFNTLLNIPNNWDLYAGATLAYNIFSYNTSEKLKNIGMDLGLQQSGIGFAGQVGGRYYFTNNFAINVEYGGGSVVSGGKAGISYKF